MNDWDQIVIGAGTSALTFLHAAFHGTQTKFKHKNTLVIGKGADQLWSKVEDHHGDHRMGQPEHLLRPSGLMPIPSAKGAHDEFVKTSDYNKTLDRLRDKIVSDRRHSPLVSTEANVTMVTFQNGKYRVDTDQAGSHTAKQVIVACGPGKGKTLSTLNIPVEAPDDVKNGTTKEYLDAVEYMTDLQPKHKRVLVYGGSASSSWAVAQAFAMEATQVLWGARRGIEQIKTEGNPVGRNSEIIAEAEGRGLIRKCVIDKITLREGTPLEERMLVEFKEMEGSFGPVGMAFDQVVYAVGANPLADLGAGRILSDPIRAALVPVWDQNYRFHDEKEKEKKEVTALKDANNLWVVGAAVYNGLGIKLLQDKIGTGDKNKYASVGQMLCGGGRPPEGIAIVDATINAVTGFRQTDPSTFNWNKANRRDIFQLLVKAYGVTIPLSAREKLVGDIIAARQQTNFGVTPAQVKQMIVQTGTSIGVRLDPTPLFKIRVD